MKKIILALFFLLITSAPRADLVTEEVDYQSADVVMKGYLVYDDKIEGKRPGILVVHEWWGHNEYARKRARMLAELGYTALAVDMYGGGKVADHPDTAGQFAKAVRERFETTGKDRFLAAREVLKNHPTVDPDKIGAIGYCFGGAAVLQMARLGVDLKGVVSFHGSLGTTAPAEAGQVKARILVCHGADDLFIPPEEIENFKKEMDSAKAEYRFISYKGALHSFTNPEADEIAKKFGMRIAYNAEADQQSWLDMKEFFAEVFQEKNENTDTDP